MKVLESTFMPNGAKKAESGMENIDQKNQDNKRLNQTINQIKKQQYLQKRKSKGKIPLLLSPETLLIRFFSIMSAWLPDGFPDLRSRHQVPWQFLQA
jgi:hypothetical protein